MDPLRERALSLAEGLQPTPKNIERVATATSTTAAEWAFSQWDLRARAKSKFALARRMLFTREALEQATHEEVARFHAAKFPAGERVVDLTCGIGSDLIALARRGPAFGVDLDSERLELARHNLEAYGLRAELEEADALDTARRRDGDYYIADPSRRLGGRRILDPNAFSPDPAALARALRGSQLSLIKLSPMLPDDYLQGLGPGLEFVSFGGECREALVLLGERAVPGRRAVQVESGEVLNACVSDAAWSEPQAWLFDPDPAATRAHAVGSLCIDYKLSLLSGETGYLTGSEPVESVWLKRYRVLEWGSYDRKRLNRDLSRHGCAIPVLKQRGAGLDLDRMKRELRSHGERGAVLAFYLMGKSLRYILAEPA